MAMDEELGLPISGMGGITTWREGAEFLLCGASLLQVTTAVMRYGYGIIQDMVDGLKRWMQDKGFKKIEDVVGKSLKNIVPHEQLSRRYRMIAEIDISSCLKDGLCYTVCHDAGHQAISFKDGMIPVVDEDKCAGCSLCRCICPVPDCIKMRLKGD
jgi:dihydropyrimidine dehydrogenase (NAD+) subunit PreA